MDNVTHSLVGYALGRARAVRSEPARRAALWTSVLASNAPDLDFIAGRMAHNRKLAYLLQHRGYTHTLLCALPIGIAIGALFVFLLRVPRGERAGVLGLGVLAALLHIGFDALNNYGVHPFFPFDNHWYYGDAVFIVEPLLLAALLPLLAQSAASRVGRVLGLGLGLLLLVLVFALPFTPVLVALLTSFVLALGWFAQRHAGMSARPALLLAAIVVACFGLSAFRAKAELRAQLSRFEPSERVLQLIASPMPGNPLCVTGLSLSLDRAMNYRARAFELSLAPAIVPRARCAFLPGSPTSPRVPSTMPTGPGLRFVDEYVVPFEQLRRLRREHCDADAALHFMRAPYVIAGARMILGDLRYDRAPGLEFAELELDGDCRDRVPPWVPPLSAWLGQ